jgi:hypothetical protein
MGSDICAVANHQLATSSIEVLAADVAQRMQVRVVYGVEHDLSDFEAQGERGQGTRTLRLSSLREEDEDADILVYELYDEPGKGEYAAYIYRDCFLAAADYAPGRFSLFCNSYTGKQNEQDAALKYRKDVYAEVQLLGGDTAIYFGDESSASFVLEDADTMPFAAILRKVKALKQIVDIGEWHRAFSGTYMAKAPGGFIDDFSYWPDAGRS